MVLRCFARRSFVLARRRSSPSQQHISPFSTDVKSARQKKDGGVTITERRRSGSVDAPEKTEFFSASRLWPAEQDKMYARADVKSKDDRLADSIEQGGRINALARPSHPAVLRLLEEVRLKGRTGSKPDADTVWRLYRSVRARKQLTFSSQNTSAMAEMSKNAEQDSLYIPPFLYKLVVRALAPPIQVDGRPRRPRMREGRLYLSRVATIFQEMRALDPHNLPSTADYNRVLAATAVTGDITALTTLWASMTGDSTRLYALDVEGEGSRRVVTQSEPSSLGTAKPTSETYFQLFKGVMRHLSDQVGQMYYRDVRAGLVPGYSERRREHKRWMEDDSNDIDIYASSSRGGHQTRQVMALATRRAAGLLDDMRRRNLRFQKSTYDVVLRIMRLCGNLTAFKQLVRMAFQADLDNPDGFAPPQSAVQSVAQRGMDVHTLNTILMALGEMSTVSKMITAYETLARPLPAVSEGGEKDAGLFATDFRGLFKKDSQTESEQPVAGQPTSALAIKPNTKTIETLIQYTANPPSAERLAMIQCYRTSAEMATEGQEHSARYRGDYVSLAFYFLRETLDVQKRDLLRNAQSLKMQMSMKKIDHFVDNFKDIDLDLGLGLDQEHATTFAQDLLDRLMFLAGGLNGDALLETMPERPASLLNEESLATRTEAQRQLARAEYAEQVKEIKARREITEAFIQANDVSVPPLPSSKRERFTWPSFTSPQIGFNTFMFEPLLKHARRKADVDGIRRIAEWMRTAMAMYVMELRVLNAAIGVWQERLRSLEGISDRNVVKRRKATRNALKPVIFQRQHDQSHLRALTELYASHVHDRLQHFALLRAERQQRRDDAAQELATQIQQEQEQAAEEERQRASRKAAALQERIARNNEEKGQASVVQAA